MNRDTDTAIDWMRQVATIRRCHSSTIVGEYPIGIHCFNMVSMYLIMCSTPRVKTIREILMHDAGELLTGDLYHVGKKYGGLGVASKRVEDLARDKAKVPLLDLFPEDFQWIHSLDLLEFWLFADDQLHLGNRNFEADHRRAWASLKNMVLPKPIRDFIQRIDTDRRLRVDRVELMEGK